MGVKSYKIEGRLKSPEYVAAVTAAYRKALDAACAGIPVDEMVTVRDRYALQMVFSRGFSTGWLDGTDHPRLTHGRYGKKRGAYAGVIMNSGQGWLDIRPEGGIGNDAVFLMRFSTQLHGRAALTRRLSSCI